MHLSQYIAKLQTILAEHGDLECVDSYDNVISEPEIIEGVLVLADEA